MNCPTCPNVKLVINERASIEIDYCPECRGVWLDRGELDKIIERSRSFKTNENLDPHTTYSANQSQQYGGKPYYKRKKSLLEELFD